SGIEGLEGNTLSALEGPGQVYLPGVKTLLNEAELLAQNIDFKGTTLLDQQAIIATEGMTRTAEDFSIHTANQVNSVSESIAKFKDQQKIKLEKIFTEYTKNADKGIKDFESHSQNSIDEGLKEIDGSIQKVKEKIEEQNKEAKEKIALRTDENIEK